MRAPSGHGQSGLQRSDQVWYAAYGSNLDRARFDCYVVGGRPPGAARTYPGCRDREPPADEAAARIPHRLYFAGASTVWGGAVAFVETTPCARAGRETLVRLYRITWEQFADVHAQDNWSGELHAGLPTLPTLRSRRVVTVGSGWYDTVVYLGEHDGAPVLTFTAAAREAVGDLAAPAGAYVETMARGLAASHGLGAHEVAEYVAAAPGAAPGPAPGPGPGVSRVR
ncbi:MAG: histone deacetylase [Acidimicrobiia bacterium]